MRRQEMATSTAIHAGYSALETNYLEQIYGGAALSGMMANQFAPDSANRDPMLGSQMLSPDQGNQTLNQVNRGGRPYIQIVEEPRSRGLRFRYKCEGRSAGTIPGASSNNENRVYPTIKICNYQGPSAIVVVSCVTKDDPPRPHPHSLVGKDCKQGVCTVKLKGTTTVSFPSLGIQCATKKEIQDALKQRQKIRVDPWGTGYYTNMNSIELSTVRLAFQAFLPDDCGKYTRIVQPTVSQCIYDKKSITDLVICRLSKQSGSVRGREEIFLLCEKVTKDDIQVRFFEETKEDGVIWEKYGEFGQQDVHRQVAIVFKTPEYRDQNISQPVTVFMQLRRPSDDEVSDPKPFQYIPNDPDPDCVTRKRKRKNINFDNFLKDYNVPNNYQPEPPVSVKDTLKQRLIKKANRNQTPARLSDGQPPVVTGSEHFQLQQYSYQNTGGQYQLQQQSDTVQHSPNHYPTQFQSPPPQSQSPTQYQVYTSPNNTTDGMIYTSQTIDISQQEIHTIKTDSQSNQEITGVVYSDDTDESKADVYAMLQANMSGEGSDTRITSLPSLPSALYNNANFSTRDFSQNLAILQEGAVQVAAEETVESMNDDS